jgi:macrolide-specific efflux system membrane fusion protein
MTVGVPSLRRSTGLAVHREAFMKLKFLAILALAAVGVGAAYVAVGGLPANAAATTQYLTGAVTTGDVTDDVAATGTVAATTSYGLAFGTLAHLAGATAATGAGGSTTWTVTDLKAKVGDTVKEGAVLAKADTTDLDRQLADATATLNSAKIQLTIAQEGLDAATTTDTKRKARMSLYNVETQVSNARNARLDLLHQIQRATLTAPIDGLVTSVAIVKGLDAPSGDAIVIESTTLQVTADVVESDLAAMKVGQAASVSIGAVDADVTGKVTAIAPTTTGNTTGDVVSYAVTVSLDKPPATVRVGMTADVTITIDSATNVLTVPASALRGTAGDYAVLVMGADGTPTAKPVEVGLVTNTTAEIKSGLTAGEAVVTGVNTPQTGTAATPGGGGLGGGFGIPGGGGGIRRQNGGGNGGGGGTGN